MMLCDEIYSNPIEAYGLAMAPDGNRVALLYRRRGMPRLSIFASGSTPQIWDAEFADGGISWSPDGTKIACCIAAPDSDGVQDIGLFDPVTGEMSNLTQGACGHATFPSWSRDGQSIVFNAYLLSPTPHAPTHIYMAQIHSGAVRQLTHSPDSLERFPQFTSDGSAVLFNRGHRAVRLELEGGAEKILTPDAGWVIPTGCCSPSGDLVALQRKREDLSQVFIMDAHTGQIYFETDPRDDVRWPTWSYQSERFAVIRDHSRVQVLNRDGTCQWEADTGGLGIQLWMQMKPHWAYGCEALALATADSNVWIFRPGAAPERLTAFPSSSPPRHRARPVQYPAGGAAIPAALLAPPVGERVSGAVVWVHGGPDGVSAFDDESSPYIQGFVDAGWIVLAPDYRGSGGHGSEWERLLPEQRGVVDVEDVVAARDYLISENLVAPDQIGIAGQSYGGYLALLALARYPGLWREGVSLWGGLNGATPLARFYFGQVIPQLDERSPLTLSDRIKTPILILHGSQDTYASVGEANSLAGLLKERGQTCDLHVFDDTHGLPRNTEEACARTLEFFGRYRGS